MKIESFKKTSDNFYLTTDLLGQTKVIYIFIPEFLYVQKHKISSVKFVLSVKTSFELYL